MNRKWAWFCAVLVLTAAAGSVSCALGDKHMTLTYPASLAQPEASGSGGPRVRLSRFADGRPTGKIVGEVYRASAKASPVWYMENDLGEFLKEALASELRDAGVAVAPDGGDADDAFRVEGKVNIFYGWATASSMFFTAAVNIDVSLLVKTRPVFVQSYVSQKTMSKIYPDCQALLGTATSDVMKQAAGDIRDFIRKEGDHEK